MQVFSAAMYSTSFVIMQHWLHEGQLNLKGNSTLKNYSFKWTFMFNKVVYTAWKW